MIEFLLGWLEAIWVILVESGPYLIAGFLIAGLLKVVIPEAWIYRHLGQDNAKSVFLASLFGVPIPLCSCSVIPTAMSLKRGGASKGATTSFLISTPETGVDSIGVTWALMDPVMTIMRPFSAMVTAFTSGSLVNVLVRRKWDDQPDEEGQRKLEESAHDHDHDHGTADSVSGVPAATDEDDASCCGEPDATPGKRGARGVARDATRYAFGPLMADLTPWFIIGFIISGLITLVVPDDFFGSTLPAGWISMVAMLFIGVPLYICATATTPVAAALMAKGLDPGSALVLLLAGPASNIATIAVVRGFLGKRVMWVYLFTIAFASLLLGASVNLVYDFLNTEPTTKVGPLTAEHTSMLAQISGLILLGLLAWHFHKLGLARSWGAKLRRMFLPVGLDLGARPVKAGLLLLLVATWLMTGVSRVGPGETGFVVRFGKVVRTVHEPGAVIHAPAPFEGLRAVPDEALRAVRIAGPDGTLSLAAITELAQQDPEAGRRARLRRADFEASTEVLTRDENLLRCEVSVHYRATDAAKLVYGIEDADALVRAHAEAALREAGLTRTADELLVGDRTVVQNETQRRLQDALDALGTGIRVVNVNLDEVHASADPGVHYAFRDVASAMEDKLRYVRQAEEYRTRRQAEARAQSTVLVAEAEADAEALLQRARGEAHAFTALREVLLAHPEAHQLRLRLEALEGFLSGKRIVAVLDPGRQVVPLPGANASEAPLFESRPPAGREDH